MKLIEYKPNIIFIMDVKNIPNEMDIDKILELIKSQGLKTFDAKEINMSIPWVHPDYRVKEKSNIPDSMKGNSWENMWIPDPLDEVTPEVWEAAKPKFSEGLARKYKAPIIFGSSGDDNYDSDFIKSLELGIEALNKIPRKEMRIPHPLSNETLSREMQDIQDVHEFYVQKSFEISGIDEIRCFANSYEQEYEWLERKKKCPLLTVKDLQWIDEMVDKIFGKHTYDLSKKSFKFWSSSFYKTHPNKFFGPLF